MKVVLINHSDVRGGASVVTYRLMRALRSAGVDATMLVVHKATADPHVHLAGPRWRLKAAFAAEHLRLLAACRWRRDNIFKLSIATHGLPLSRHPLVKGADAIILNWVNQGMLSLDEIGRIAREKPVVWTMHDMWNLTSLCHHAGTCTRYIATPGCPECPLTAPKLLSAHTWLRKRRLYKGAGIRFVAVSSWLAKLCAGSSLMQGMDVQCIPNAFPVDEFAIEPTRPRSALGLPEGKKLIVMGAARLDDPVKGLDFAIEALNGLRRDDAVAVFYGALRDPAALDALRFPHTWLGTVDGADVRDIFAHAKVVMSSSRYETLPGTLIEGMAAGCVPVSFDRGGQCDIIASPDDGFLVAAYDTAAFTAALNAALDSSTPRQHFRQAVADRFAASTIAQQYIKLLTPLVNK